MQTHLQFNIHRFKLFVYKEQIRGRISFSIFFDGRVSVISCFRTPMFQFQPKYGLLRVSSEKIHQNEHVDGTLKH